MIVRNFARQTGKTTALLEYLISSKKSIMILVATEMQKKHTIHLAEIIFGKEKATEKITPNIFSTADLINNKLQKLEADELVIDELGAVLQTLTRKNISLIYGTWSEK